MTSRDITLLVNPRAGSGTAMAVGKRVATFLSDRGCRVTLPQLPSVEVARAQARAAASRGDSGVVVVGGDGMCHLAIQEIAGTTTALGIVPVGTGNDFASALGFPADPEPAATGIVRALSGANELVDLGRADQRWWASVLCAGFDSAVNDRANRMRWPRGPRRYDLAVLAELSKLRTVPMTLGMVRDDGSAADPLECDVTLVAVGNTRCYGGGIPICPDADPTDGLLDVTVVGPISRTGLIRVMPTLRRGQHLAHPAVRTYRARSVTLACPAGRRVTAYADGEPIQSLPVSVTCQPGALRLLRGHR